MTILCRLIGHRWNPSVIDIVVPVAGGENAVYKAERCRRCRVVRPRDESPDNQIETMPRQSHFTDTDKEIDTEE